MEDKKGFVVFTINVGNLPPYKAEAFISRVRDNFGKIEDWYTLFIPVRGINRTRVEVFALTEKGHKEIRPKILKIHESFRIAELEAKLAEAQETIRDLEAMMEEKQGVNNG